MLHKQEQVEQILQLQRLMIIKKSQMTGEKRTENKNLEENRERNSTEGGN